MAHGADKSEPLTALSLRSPDLLDPHFIFSSSWAFLITAPPIPQVGGKEMPESEAPIPENILQKMLNISFLPTAVTMSRKRRFQVNGFHSGESRLIR